MNDWYRSQQALAAIRAWKCHFHRKPDLGQTDGRLIPTRGAPLDAIYLKANLMAKHGSETRQRTHQLCVRLTPEEADLVRETAGKAGMSVAGLIRYALLEQKPPRAARVPPVSEQDAAQILAMQGLIRSALLEAAACGNREVSDALFEAACRDIADMRGALMEALGRQP